MSQIAKRFTVSRIEDAASPLRHSRRAQGGRERPPFWGAGPPKTVSAQPRVAPAHAAPKPSFLYDIVDDIGDDADVDDGANSERDSCVDHDNFNPVDESRIVRESPTSSRAIEEDSPCP